VNSIEDLKGLKIRVMNDPIMIDTVNTLGALATPLAYGELYTALQQGVVDGAEQPPVSLYTMKFYEVSKYFSLTKHFYDLNVVVMGKMFFDKLTPEQQQAVLEAGQETQAYERKIWKEYEDGILDKLKAEGVEVNSLDLAPFQEAVADILEQNKDKVGGAEFVETVLSYR
jgi:TRAP-type C4-dicarboxylate transport system substrate-binding protein